MAAGDESVKNLDRRAARGEDAPGWLPAAQQRASEEIRKLELEEQRRLGYERPGARGPVSAAAESARRIRASSAEGQTQAYKTVLDLSKVSELFIALGMKGVAADPNGAGKFNPGWFGRMAEIYMADDALDVHKGIDFLARFSIGEREYVLGIDVTTSDKKLDMKFAKMRKMLNEGEATALYDAPGSPVALRLVVGVSSSVMREAVREWSKDGPRVEAYDEANAALGACIREQVIVQLTEFKAYLEDVSAPKALALAATYGAVLDAMAKWPAPKVKDNPFKQDPLHQNILRWARSFNED